MPDTDPETGKTQRFLIACITAMTVLCGWGFVLWQLRK